MNYLKQINGIGPIKMINPLELIIAEFNKIDIFNFQRNELTELPVAHHAKINGIEYLKGRNEIFSYATQRGMETYEGLILNWKNVFDSRPTLQQDNWSDSE